MYLIIFANSASLEKSIDSKILFLLPFKYCIIASSNTSRLEAHGGFFQIAYEGDFQISHSAVG